MILVRIKSRQNGAELEMAFPTSKQAIADAYENLGTKNTQLYAVKYLDCEYKLLERKSGRKRLRLEQLGGANPELEEINCLAERWEEMNDRQKGIIERWNEIWGDEKGNMKKLLNAAYTVDSYEITPAADPEEAGRITVKKGCRFPKDIYYGTKLPVEPEEYVFQLRYGEDVLNLPADSEILERCASIFSNKEMVRFRTVIKRIDCADLQNLTGLNLLAKEFESLTDTDSRIERCASIFSNKEMVRFRMVIKRIDCADLQNLTGLNL